MPTRPLAKLRSEGIETISGNGANADIFAAANAAAARRLILAIPNAFEAGQIIQRAESANPAHRDHRARAFRRRGRAPYRTRRGHGDHGRARDRARHHRARAARWRRASVDQLLRRLYWPEPMMTSRIDVWRLTGLPLPPTSASGRRIEAVSSCDAPFFGAAGWTRSAGTTARTGFGAGGAGSLAPTSTSGSGATTPADAARPAAGQLRDRHAFMRGDHEFVPGQRRQRAAGHLLHRRAVVVAEPDAGGEVGGVADEPGVARILAGAGLAGRRPGEGRLAWRCRPRPCRASWRSSCRRFRAAPRAAGCCAVLS